MARPKVHIPFGDEMACGVKSFRVDVDDSLCVKCLARVERILLKHGYVVQAVEETKP